MEEPLKKMFSLLLALLIVCTSLSPAYASQTEDEAMPRLNTMIDVSSAANLSSSGLLYVINTYATNDSQISRVVVTTYVEKRNLLLFWDRVDIGTTNDEWVDRGGNGDFSKAHTAQMPGSGTYRVTVTFEVYNSSNTLLDSIEKVIKKSY